MIDALREIKQPAGDMAWRQSLSHCSIFAHDFAERLRQTADKKDHFGRVLLAISPYSAYAMGTLGRGRLGSVKGDVPAWLDKVGDAPALIGTLGKKYVELNQYEGGGEIPEALHGALPATNGSISHWRACYEAHGDHNRAKATLDDYLTKTEAVGLEHAQVQVQIANDLMKQGRCAGGEEVRRSGRVDLGRLWDGMCLRVLRRTQGLGSGRALDAAHSSGLPHSGLGPLVHLLQSDRPR